MGHPAFSLMVFVFFWSYLLLCCWYFCAWCSSILFSRCSFELRHVLHCFHPSIYLCSGWWTLHLEHGLVSGLSSTAYSIYKGGFGGSFKEFWRSSPPWPHTITNLRPVPRGQQRHPSFCPRTQGGRCWRHVPRWRGDDVRFLSCRVRALEAFFPGLEFESSERMTFLRFPKLFWLMLWHWGYHIPPSKWFRDFSHFAFCSAHLKSQLQHGEGVQQGGCWPKGEVQGAKAAKRKAKAAGYTTPPVRTPFGNAADNIQRPSRWCHR